jgi:protein-S-isoprenylcysteine O-methyltransferase Ste14
MPDETVFRWLLGMILVSAISISGYYRQRAQRATGAIARRQEKPLLIGLRLVFGLPLLLSLLAFLIRPEWMAWARLPTPVAIRWAGVAIGGISMPLVIWVMRSIGSNISETVLTKQKHELVTVGPYRWIRHPLYFTGLVLLVSATLMASNWFIGALTVIAAVAIHHVIVPAEEAALIQKFGDDYREYMNRSGRLLPGRQG